MPTSFHIISCLFFREKKEVYRKILILFLSAQNLCALYFPIFHRQGGYKRISPPVICFADFLISAMPCPLQVINGDSIHYHEQWRRIRNRPRRNRDLRGSGYLSGFLNGSYCFSHYTGLILWTKALGYSGKPVGYNACQRSAGNRTSLYR